MVAEDKQAFLLLQFEAFSLMLLFISWTLGLVQRFNQKTVLDFQNVKQSVTPRLFFYVQNNYPLRNQTKRTFSFSNKTQLSIESLRKDIKLAGDHESH